MWPDWSPSKVSRIENGTIAIAIRPANGCNRTFAVYEDFTGFARGAARAGLVEPRPVWRPTAPVMMIPVAWENPATSDAVWRLRGRR